jgi:hypothetical protein
MYPESEDTEALDSVDDKNKGPNALADDITKRLVANCKPLRRQPIALAPCEASGIDSFIVLLRGLTFSELQAAHEPDHPERCVVLELCLHTSIGSPPHPPRLGRAAIEADRRTTGPARCVDSIHERCAGRVICVEQRSTKVKAHAKRQEIGAGSHRT